MGLQRLLISASSVAALVALFASFGTTCVDCDQAIAASGTTTTAEPTGTGLDEADLQPELRIGADLDITGFAAQVDPSPIATESTTTTDDQSRDASTTTTDDQAGDDSTTTTDDQSGDDSTTTAISKSADTTSPGAAGTVENTTGGGDGDAPSTSTTTTSPPATVAPPPPVGSNVPVSGSKIYVNPNGGNDGNDGSSEGSALKSFQNALRRVKAGQTVYLMSGEYRELQDPGALHYFLHNSGSSGNWIRITNAPGHSPVIVATDGTGLLIEADYVEVSGIQVRGQGFGNNNPWGVGIAIADSHHVRVLNSRVSGMPVSGISANRSSNVHLINNVVYENSFWSDVNGSGISFFHQRDHGQGADYGRYHDVVIGNRVFRNENKVNSKFQAAKGIQIKTDGNGIIVDSNKASGYGGRTLVANNLAYDNGGRGILAYDSNRVDILFNTTYHNVRTQGLLGEGAEVAAYKVSDVRVEHNIAWARSGRRAFTFGEYSNSSTKGNVFITDHSDSHAFGSDSVMTGNPGLRNPSTNGGSADFRPSPGGGLIGKAAYDGTVSRDIAGTSRGGGVEPGAFEAEAGSGR